MNIYILASVLVLILVFSYIASNRDIMAPSVLLTAGYFLACLCCMYNIDNWAVNLKFHTCFLIVLGVVFFVLGDLFQNVLHKNRPLQANEIIKSQEIVIPNYIICFFVLYDLLVLFLTFKEIVDMAGGLVGTIGSLVGQFRYAYAYTDYRSNTLNVQLLKVCKGAAYTFLFVFFNNAFVNKKTLIKNIKYLIPVVIFAFITLVKGGRINAIMIIISGLFLYYYNWHRKVGWNKSISVRFIKAIFIAFIAFVILFFGTREFVGRKETTAVSEYVTTYIGGSFQLLDQYLESSASSTGEGLETFPGIIQTLNKLGLSGVFPHKALEFRYSSTGVYLGNVYTGLRRYYHDFGYLGMMFIQFVYGYLFSYLYRKIKQMAYLDSRRLFLLVTYASLLFCIITQGMEDHFWIDMSLGFFIELIVMRIVVKIIMDYRLKGTSIRIGYWIG